MGYVPSSHGEEGGGVGGERRGFEEEGDKILKAGDERREGGESKIVTVQDAPRSGGADWPAETLARMTRGARAAGSDSRAPDTGRPLFASNHGLQFRPWHCRDWSLSCSWPASL